MLLSFYILDDIYFKFFVENIIFLFQNETPDEVASNNNGSPNKSPLLAFSEVTNTLLEENGQ